MTARIRASVAALRWCRRPVNRLETVWTETLAAAATSRCVGLRSAPMQPCVPRTALGADALSRSDTDRDQRSGSVELGHHGAQLVGEPVGLGGSLFVQPVAHRFAHVGPDEDP